jgi:predicted ArsR family transcriptional regulator
VGALQEPARRALYLYVLDRHEPVSRDEAADAAGIRRALAAFHLDRLADEGLLEVQYRRLSGRTGPGAGRPSKLYVAAEVEHDLTLPPRAYALVAGMLAETVETVEKQRGSRRRGDAALVARRRGEAVGEALRATLPTRPTATQLRNALWDALTSHGYQPQRDGKAIRLANCPFHALARDHTELVCGMNHAFLQGLVAALGARNVEASLDLAAGGCCVVLR